MKECRPGALSETPEVGVSSEKEREVPERGRQPGQGRPNNSNAGADMSSQNPANLRRVLLVEDDARLANLVAEFLTQHRLIVEIEPRGDRAVERIVNERPDVVVLDLMLPGMNGLDVCREARTRFSGPLLILTARDDDMDQILGLELGADDYVIKPADPRVLLARVRALLRRTDALSGEDGAFTLTFGALWIDRRARRVSLAEETIALTDGEFDLLWLLASNAGRTLSRDVILSSLRRIDYDGVDRSIDICISRLRRKLHDTTTPPQRIKAVRGKGYLFVEDAWAGN
jgi:DNA-binding response OmpR family regulator